jgi:transposase
MSARKQYPSDVSREQFEKVCPLLEGVRKRTKPRIVDLYEVFNAVLYLLKSGCQWRMLPDGFPKWRTVHSYNAQVERARPGRYQRSGTGLKKNQLARPEPNRDATPRPAS